MDEIQRNPDISPQELAAWLQADEPLVILDVREPYEWSWASISDPRVLGAPLSELNRRGLEALPDEAQDPEKKLVVLCHLGERSAMVTAWLVSQGRKNVFNLAGGIDAYARVVDPSIGFYG
jgi:rhodanese-related sulfurtransferase